MRNIIFIYFIAICGLSQASETTRPIGVNCTLSEPPTDAGEGAVHGMTIRIYPRAKDITSNYTGCQTVFAEIDGKWGTVVMTEVVDGDPIRIWSDDETSECLYQKGRVIRGNPGKCPSPDDLLFKSMPSGCVKARHEAVREVAEKYARKLVGCEYE
jgi:hypothetical protein